MPELPEVETVMRGLSPAMAGKKIERVDLNRAGLRVPFPPYLSDHLAGRGVDALSRRAKYILIHVGLDILVIHLGMSGHMTIIPKAVDYKPQKHDHMIIHMEGGGAVIFNDPRRFGMVMMMTQADMKHHPAFAALGPEPLEGGFTGSVLQERLRGKKVSIKTALLDQRVLAGVGNIYACEALFMARISPIRMASSLTKAEGARLVEAIQRVLTEAIEAGGSSLRDHQKTDGTLGYFQHRFLVYDREGLPCSHPHKKKSTVQRMVQGGRSTFYCSVCQK